MSGKAASRAAPAFLLSLLQADGAHPLPTHDRTMHVLITAFMIFHHVAALGSTCPNLSGRFGIQGEDGVVDVVVKQVACTHITIDWVRSYLGQVSHSPQTLALDRKFHRKGPEPGTRSARLVMAHFQGDTLEIVSKALAAPDSLPVHKQRIVRLPTGNICISHSNQDADSWSGVMAGVEDKPSTAAKDEADQYFEKGCPGVRFGASIGRRPHARFDA
jgi:hypothetical protein